MKDRQLLDVNRRHLGAICLCIIAIILFAGLWPREFHFENQVALLADGEGVRFSGRGIIYASSSLIRRPAAAAPGPLTIEIAVQPEKEWGRSLPAILALDDGQPCERLLISQWKKHLIIRSRRKACFQSGEYAELDLENSLPKGKAQFITIASGNNGTALYLNGALVKRNRGFSLLGPGGSLSGRLILGNSSDGSRPWTGIVSTLAIYDRMLSAGEALQHYKALRERRGPSPQGNGPPISDYRFDEKAGPVVKDHSGRGNDLIIPEYFAPLHRRMLTPPWDDFQASGAYARDVAINILGFIPFGFYLAWYLSERGVKSPRAALMALALGVGASLFIEIVQAYLPERTSQLIDVITNSSGTAIGAYLWYKYISRSRSPV